MIREIYFGHLGNGAPDHYWIQPMHYPGRYGLDKACLAMFKPNGAGIMVEAYPRDREPFGLMPDAGNCFWRLAGSQNMPDVVHRQLL